MKHKVDIETWERRENWLFMSEFANSWYSITSEVDCTKAFDCLLYTSPSPRDCS